MTWRFGRWLLVSAALQMVCAVVIGGRLHPDEVHQWLEPAWRWVVGYGTTTREWYLGMRNVLGPGLVAFIALMVIFMVLAVYLLKAYGTEGWVAPTLLVLFALICLFPIIAIQIAATPRQQPNVLIDHLGPLRVTWVALGCIFSLFGHIARLYFRVVHNPYAPDPLSDVFTAIDGQPESFAARVWRVPLRGTVADGTGRRTVHIALKQQ